MNFLPDPGNVLLAISAWVFCIDTSTSLHVDEFNKLKEIAKQTIQSAITYNDVVWLIQIDGGTTSPFHIKMPSPPLRPIPMEIRKAEEEIRRVKKILVTRIDALTYRATTTNLCDPIELGIRILQEQHATRKIFIAGSDFVSDLPGGTPTLKPRAPPEGLTARNCQVLLLFAYPTDSYLKRLRMSRAECYQEARKAWCNYFTGLGAALAQMKLVDSVPVTTKAK